MNNTNLTETETEVLYEVLNTFYDTLPEMYLNDDTELTTEQVQEIVLSIMNKLS